MKRILLKALNTPGLILIAILAIAIQTSVFSGSLARYFQPDAILILVIWCALKRPFGEGGVLTLVFGNIAEIHSGAPQGLFLILSMLVFLGVRSASRYFVIQNRLHWVLLSLICLVLHHVGLWFALSLLDAPVPRLGYQSLLLLPALGSQSILAYFAFPWLENYDWSTYKSPKAQRLLEDELHLEGEGL